MTRLMKTLLTEGPRVGLLVAKCFGKGIVPDDSVHRKIPCRGGDRPLPALTARPPPPPSGLSVVQES